MKKLLLLILFGIQLSGLNAQTNVYHPMLTDSTTLWRYSWVDVCSTSPIVICTYYYDYKISGNTIFAGQTYKIVKKNVSNSYCNCIPHNGGVPITFTYYLREDTLAKKVYSYDSIIGDKLIYDFSLSVGDTMPGYGNCQIATIDSILIGGNYRKRFISVSSWEFIEGIGDVGSAWGGNEADLVYHPCGGSLSPNTKFICFKQNNIDLYVKDSSACGLALNVEENKYNNFEVSVFPNPTTSTITIETDKTDCFYELKNMLGQTVFTSKFSNKINIDLSNFDNGIYFVRVMDEKGNSVVKKIIKQ